MSASRHADPKPPVSAPRHPRVRRLVAGAARVRADAARARRSRAACAGLGGGDRARRPRHADDDRRCAARRRPLRAAAAGLRDARPAHRADVAARAAAGERAVRRPLVARHRLCGAESRRRARRFGRPRGPACRARQPAAVFAAAAGQPLARDADGVAPRCECRAVRARADARRAGAADHAEQALGVSPARAERTVAAGPAHGPRPLPAALQPDAVGDAARAALSQVRCC